MEVGQEANVLGDRLPGQQRRGLGDEAEALRRSGGVGVCARDGDGATVGSDEAADDPQQGRLSTTAGPEEAHELTCGDVKVDVSQRNGLTPAATEHLAHAIEAHVSAGRLRPESSGRVVLLFSHARHSREAAGQPGQRGVSRR